MTSTEDRLLAAEVEAADLAGLQVLAKSEAKRREALRLLRASEARADSLEDALAATQALRACAVKPLKIRKGKRTRSRDPHTAVALVSDWHSAEIVDPGEVNGLNRHNQEIGMERAEKYTRDLAKMVHGYQDRFHIETLVLAMLGDALVGELHGVESARSCDLTPIEEVLFVKPLLVRLIDHLLSELDCNLVIPCICGNHDRTTEKPRHRKSAGYSYMQLIYVDLADRYTNPDSPFYSDRVEFDVSESQHKVVDAGGFRMLVAHGDRGLRYGGGVGGLAVPFNRVMGQGWGPTYNVKIGNVGHYHTRNSFRLGFTNGCLVGYNVYAKDMALPYERPSQWLYLVDHERQDVGTACPIWVD